MTSYRYFDIGWHYCLMWFSVIAGSFVQNYFLFHFLFYVVVVFFTLDTGYLGIYCSQNHNCFAIHLVGSTDLFPVLKLTFSHTVSYLRQYGRYGHLSWLKRHVLRRHCPFSGLPGTTCHCHCPHSVSQLTLDNSLQLTTLNPPNSEALP